MDVQQLLCKVGLRVGIKALPWLLSPECQDSTRARHRWSSVLSPPVAWELWVPRNRFTNKQMGMDVSITATSLNSLSKFSFKNHAAIYHWDLATLCQLQSPALEILVTNQWNHLTWEMMQSILKLFSFAAHSCWTFVTPGKSVGIRDIFSPTTGIAYVLWAAESGSQRVLRLRTSWVLHPSAVERLRRGRECLVLFFFFF